MTEQKDSAKQALQQNSAGAGKTAAKAPGKSAPKPLEKASTAPKPTIPGPLSQALHAAVERALHASTEEKEAPTNLPQAQNPATQQVSPPLTQEAIAQAEAGSAVPPAASASPAAEPPQTNNAHKVGDATPSLSREEWASPQEQGDSPESILTSDVVEQAAHVRPSVPQAPEPPQVQVVQSFTATASYRPPSPSQRVETSVQPAQAQAMPQNAAPAQAEPKAAPRPQAEDAAKMTPPAPPPPPATQPVVAPPVAAQPVAQPAVPVQQQADAPKPDAPVAQETKPAQKPEPKPQEQADAPAQAEPKAAPKPQAEETKAAPPAPPPPPAAQPELLINATEKTVAPPPPPPPPPSATEKPDIAQKEETPLPESASVASAIPESPTMAPDQSAVSPHPEQPQRAIPPSDRPALFIAPPSTKPGPIVVPGAIAQNGLQAEVSNGRKVSAQSAETAAPSPDEADRSQEPPSSAEEPSTKQPRQRILTPMDKTVQVLPSPPPAMQNPSFEPTDALPQEEQEQIQRVRVPAFQPQPHDPEYHEPVLLTLEEPPAAENDSTADSQEPVSGIEEASPPPVPPLPPAPPEAPVPVEEAAPEQDAAQPEVVPVPEVVPPPPAVTKKSKAAPEQTKEFGLRQGLICCTVFAAIVLGAMYLSGSLGTNTVEDIILQWHSSAQG